MCRYVGVQVLADLDCARLDRLPLFCYVPLGLVLLGYCVLRVYYYVPSVRGSSRCQLCEFLLLLCGSAAHFHLTFCSIAEPGLAIDWPVSVALGLAQLQAGDSPVSIRQSAAGRLPGLFARYFVGTVNAHACVPRWCS